MPPAPSSFYIRTVRQGPTTICWLTPRSGREIERALRLGPVLLDVARSARTRDQIRFSVVMHHLDIWVQLHMLRGPVVPHRYPQKSFATVPSMWEMFLVIHVGIIGLGP
jgi:hypothetical protein